VSLSYLALIIGLLLANLPSFSQITTKSHRIDRELHFRYDNDLYFGTDQYYTSGVDITYGRIINKESNFYERFKSRRSDSLKLIGRIQYGHKIFTPSKIKEKYVTRFDRPYAGWHYLKFHLQNHPGENIVNRYMIELGLVGGMSGIGNFHTWWHEKMGFPQPRGWQYEIGNEVILNFAYNRSMMWSPVRRIGFFSDTGIKLGNGINQATQELSLRYGKANRLFNSAKRGSRLSKHIPVVGNSDPEEEEGFFFYGIEGRYILNNVFIEGSLIRNEVLHQEELEKYVIVKKWGFIYSNYYTTFSFVVYNISPENKGARRHRYISVNLALRF